MNKLTNSRSPQLDNELCVEQVGGNRFNLVLIAAIRAKEIKRQAAKSGAGVVSATIDALLEVQSGKIGKEYLKRIV